MVHLPGWGMYLTFAGDGKNSDKIRKKQGTVGGRQWAVGSQNLRPGIWNLETKLKTQNSNSQLKTQNPKLKLVLRLNRYTVEQHARGFTVHLDLVFDLVKEMIFKEMV